MGLGRQLTRAQSSSKRALLCALERQDVRCSRRGPNTTGSAACSGQTHSSCHGSYCQLSTSSVPACAQSERHALTRPSRCLVTEGLTLWPAHTCPACINCSTGFDWLAIFTALQIEVRLRTLVNGLLMTRSLWTAHTLLYRLCKRTSCVWTLLYNGRCMCISA